MKIVLPFTSLIGMSPIICSESGVELRRTKYSRGPIFIVPDGSSTFCNPSAVVTSAGDSPFANSSPGSMSTFITRPTPPFAGGIVSPWIVASGVRMKLFARSFSCASVRTGLLIPS